MAVHFKESMWRGIQSLFLSITAVSLSLSRLRVFVAEASLQRISFQLLRKDLMNSDELR